MNTLPGLGYQALDVQIPDNRPPMKELSSSSRYLILRHEMWPRGFLHLARSVMVIGCSV